MWDLRAYQTRPSRTVKLTLTAAELHEIDGAAAVDVQRVEQSCTCGAKVGMGEDHVFRGILTQGALVFVP